MTEEQSTARARSNRQKKSNEPGWRSVMVPEVVEVERRCVRLGAVSSQLVRFGCGR